MWEWARKISEQDMGPLMRHETERESSLGLNWGAMTSEDAWALRLLTATQIRALGLEAQFLESPALPFPAKVGMAFYADLVKFAREFGGSNPSLMERRVKIGQVVAFISRRHPDTIVPTDCLAKTLKSWCNADYDRGGAFYVSELKRQREGLGAPSKPRSAKAFLKDSG